jgi:thymidylate synthase
MNNLDKQYKALLQDILDNGVEKKDRTSTGTISVFGRQIRHNMKDGFPLLTTKKMAWKTMVTELLWFLRGDTNIKFLVNNDCHIWDGDAYKRYWGAHPDAEKSFQYEGHNMEVRRMTKDEFISMIKTDDEFAKKWGELGPIYGKQWRNWGKDFKQIPNETGNGVYHITTTGIDQIQNLIINLKTNPDSRRLMVNAWNVGEIDSMVLPPCHYGFQVYTRELSLEERERLVKGELFDFIAKHQSNDWWERGLSNYERTIEALNNANIPTRAISLMWNQRSVDTFLGLPFNIASYGLLLEIIAKEVNMVPDQLIGNLGDVHLYSNHVEQAKEQIGRKLTIDERMDWWFENKKPNRDVCDRVDEQTPYGKEVYFDSVGVPKTTREPFPLPKLNILHNPCKDIEIEGKTTDISCYNIFDLTLENYQSHPAIKAPLSN